MPVGRSRADAGDARGVGKGEAGRAFLGDQIKGCLQQRLFQIAMMIAAFGAALFFFAPAHVKGFYMKPASIRSPHGAVSGQADLLTRNGLADFPKRLAAGNRKNRHDLDGLTREDRKMRMILEHLRCRLMRSGANHRKGAHRVGDVGNPLPVDFLVLPSGPPIATMAA